MLAILMLVLVGGVLVAYLWETLNRLATGFVEPVRLLIAIPVLAIFALLLRYIARLVTRWDSQPDA
jgi:ABC-type proline/glycine betaine transport system permease subunit